MLNKIEVFTKPVAAVKAANVLRKLLFGYVIFNFLQLIPVLQNLYGNSSLIVTQHLTGFTLTTLVNLLSVDVIKNYYLVFFIIQLLFALVGLFGFFPRVCTIIVFFTTINLQNRIYSTNSGGDNLLALMLFYLIFISGGKVKNNLTVWQFGNLKMNENVKKQITGLRNMFDNIFIGLCKLQLIIIYLVSAIYKLQSPEWVSGSALQQVLLIDEFSLPALQQIVCSFPFVFKLLTWFTLLYQILFPFLIFVKRLKNYLLFTGIVFHLSIAFAMGLFNFSLVMIFCYVIFYDFDRNTVVGAL